MISFYDFIELVKYSKVGVFDMLAFQIFKSLFNPASLK
jgi:hypothetical protein